MPGLPSSFCSGSSGRRSCSDLLASTLVVAYVHQVPSPYHNSRCSACIYIYMYTYADIATPMASRASSVGGGSYSGLYGFWCFRNLGMPCWLPPHVRVNWA